MNQPTRVAVVSLLTLITHAPARAQEPPVIVSPEVRPDRTVVFRFWAPKAIEVQLSGDWMGSRPPLPLTKDNQGVWTITAGPMEPNIYSYAFVADGARSDDPACRCTYTWGGGRGSSSRFTIRSAEPAPWDNQNRAPGTLHHERFYSRLQQRTRGFVVYTPPGYDPKAARRYPVLVLLPGTPGDETDWTSGGGFVEVLFDNLIAEGRMTPMIVVMHASDVDPRAELRRGDDNLHQFETILVDELIPAIKQRYRVDANANSWAIAGLSLGGEFGMFAGLRHPELFRTIASLSGSLVPSSFDARFGAALGKPETAKNYKLIWIGCGAEDGFFNGAKTFVQRLQSTKVPHVWREFSGSHSMPVFRHELVDLLPRLFAKP
jgi:enterochelin esterase-like enzyme